MIINLSISRFINNYIQLIGFDVNLSILKKLIEYYDLVNTTIFFKKIKK